jgi:ATP-binding cassette subfamily B protein/ATP-binding cassette subfamily C protein LapB
MMSTIQKSANASILEAFRSILSFHFGNVSLDTIEKLSFCSLEKFSVKDIGHICKELSLEFQQTKSSVKDIEPFMLPCIAYNKKGEAIVIMEILDNKALIKKGLFTQTREVSLKKLQNDFNHFLLFANKQTHPDRLNIGKEKDKSWFFTPIKKEWRAYVEVSILTLFINIFGLALPLFTMSVYNRVVPNYATDTLLVLAVGVGVILIFDIFLKSARMQILENVVKKISNLFEEELFKKTLTLQSKYDNFMVGTKTNLFKELHVVKDFFATKLVHILDVPFFLTAITVIFIIDPVITLVPLTAAVLILGFNFIMQHPIALWHKKSFEEGQTKQGYLVEQLQGHEAIKLANALPTRLYKWRKMINFYHHIQGRIQLLNGISASVSTALLQAVSLLTVVAGVYSIHAGTLNVGGLIAVTILANRAMVPIINLSNIMIKYKQVKEALESLNNYWHLPTENQKYHELGFGKARGDIAFDKVSFVYPQSGGTTLEDISFEIKAGERVGIIGQTGAGKSTIQKLLCGLLTPTKGKIFLDKSDISTIHPVELRQNIALMPQDPYLFSGTLKENLELNQKISKEKMNEILVQTGLDELVRKSGSADTLNVGERGSHLSVGQRHLVALARALMSDAPVMILDEPTTGLDVGLERKLVTHLDSTLKDRTVIVITHRFAALDLVDRVIVVDSGRIVADGKKDRILEMLRSPKVKTDA